MAYVRTVRTASGATAVQIVWFSRRGSRDIEHIGSAHDDAELGALKAAARQRLAARQAELDLARLVNPTGRLGIAGVYAEKDLHPAPEGSGDGRLTVPWATLFSKGVTVGFGRTHDRRYTAHLRDLILRHRARPGFVVTHHGPLAEAPAFYRAFDQRADGIVKAVLTP